MRWVPTKLRFNTLTDEKLEAVGVRLIEFDIRRYFVLNGGVYVKNKKCQIEVSNE